MESVSFEVEYLPPSIENLLKFIALGMMECFTEMVFTLLVAINI